MTPNEIKKQRFEELFRKNYSRLFYCALDVVNDSETAKDIVSELFGDLWERFDEMNKEHVEAYLYTSVRNRSLNYLKHQTIVDKYQETYLAEKEHLVSDDMELHEARLRLIEQTIASFTPLTRHIFEQCYFEGKTYQQMAEVLQVSVSAIHKHMNKAFTAFRTVFIEKKL